MKPVRYILRCLVSSGRNSIHQHYFITATSVDGIVESIFTKNSSMGVWF